MKTDPALAEDYVRQGWWSRESVSALVRRHAGQRPDRVAYLDGERRWTWAEYDATADDLAALLTGLGVTPGDRVAVYLPDGAVQHAAYVATERSGTIAVGVPARAGEREIAQLAGRSSARVLLLSEDRSAPEPHALAARVRESGADFDHHVVLRADGNHEARTWRDGAARPAPVERRAPAGVELAPDEVWLLNFTSGTTGLPKAVMQTQNRWFYLAGQAGPAARIDGDDIVLCAVPGPYGFGLWTGHMLPVLHGLTCCLTARFSPEETLRMIERHRVSVLACVTTQLVMMMGSPLFEQLDLSSLRVVFTGGERVPTQQAERWEQVTGSRVLQFYGSNEAGPFSCTSLDDDDRTRLTTAGRVVPGVTWRLLEAEHQTDDRGEVTVGQATLRSPGAHAGYWDDPEANAQLWTDDGFLILPDVVAIDAEETVRVVGRKSDIIIRGGKNISAVVVEQGVAAHPAVRMAVAVPVPDPTFGERIGVAVALQDPDSELTLEELNADLQASGVSKEHLPEHLLVLPDIPMSMGAKADKQRIKALFTS